MNGGVNNLIPMNKRTKEEQREIARKGGIASGKARQEKATFKKTLESVLDTVPKIEGNEENHTYRELIVLGQIKGAVEGKAENFKRMAQVLGEMESETPTSTPEVKIE
jgi:general stress protein YciG